MKLKKLNERYISALESAMQMGDPAKINESPAQRNTVRSLAEIDLLFLEKFWINTVSVTAYESYNEFLMQPKVHSIYDKCKKLAIVALESVRSQILLYEHIKDLCDEIEKEVKLKDYTFKDALSTVITKQQFKDIYEKETKGAGGKTLHQKLDEEIIQLTAIESDMGDYVKSQDSVDERSSFRIVIFQIEVCRDLLRLIQSRAAANLVDFDKYKESIKILFDLQWTKADVLQSIQKLSDKASAYFDTPEFTVQIQEIYDYINEYKNREYYKHLKNEIVSQDTVSLINNHLYFYYKR